MKWFFAIALVIQAHFAASYLVPAEQAHPGRVRRAAPLAMAVERG
jgi:hypothetical protein